MHREGLTVVQLFLMFPDGAADERGVFRGSPVGRETVVRSVGIYFGDKANTDGIKRIWAFLRRGCRCAFRRINKKHLARYVQEFSGRIKSRNRVKLAQVVALASCMVGKRLRCMDLIMDNGLPGGARP